MRRMFSIVMMLVLAMLCAVPTAMAANDAAGQIVTLSEANRGPWYYDVDGERTSNTTFPGGDAVVELSKSVTPTGTENEFEVLLKVRTTEDIRDLRSDTPDAAVMLIIDVSNSMDNCVQCNREANDHWNQNHQFVSRLTEAKSAAKQFLDDFVNKTGVETGDKRYVAIVDFGSMAARRLNWVDVTNAQQLTAAKQLIDGLTVAHSNTKWDAYDDGGTNIEAALMLGANIWSQSGNAVQNIDHKYTILLTDGNPTYHVNDNQKNYSAYEAIYGTQGGGNETEQADAKDVGIEAKRILDLGSQSRLYSICYGREPRQNGGYTDVWDKEPFGNWNNANPKTTNDMTVGEWLEAFSTAAYNGGTSESLFAHFNSIITQIQLAAQAWKVEDTMGAYAVYGGEVAQSHNNKHSVSGNVLEWDVLNSNVATANQNGNTVVLEYTFKYKVTLDNLNAAYRAGAAADTNAVAELTYAVLDDQGLWQRVDPVEFPKPQVKGYEGTLSFKKVEMIGGVETPVVGMQFQLVPSGSAKTGETWSSGTVTSDSNGVVTFTGIPSGHTYELEELNAGEKGYVDLGDIPVSVSWGTAASSALAGGKLLNTHADRSITLNLAKAFANDNRPDSLTFTITNTDGYHRVVTLSGNSWSETITGLLPGKYTIVENSTWAGYNVTTSATVTDAQGNTIASSSGNTITADLTMPGNDKYVTYNLSFHNEYSRKVGSATVSKIFQEFDHQALISGNVGATDLVDLPSDLLSGINVEIEFINEAGVAAAILELPVRNSNGSMSWTARVDNLPIGTYKINEIVTGVIPEHEYVNVEITANGSAVQNDQVVISENTTLGIQLANHYIHYMGDIRVAKSVQSVVQGEQITLPEDLVFYVDVYKAVYSDATGAYSYTGSPVTTIEVAKNVSGNWVGTSVDIPVGDYYLVERTNGLNVGGNTFVSGVFENPVVTVTAGEAPAYVNLTNTYRKDMGTLTVEKKFEGLPADKYPASIHIKVLNRADNSLAATLVMTANNGWKASTQLPLGTYYLEEITSAGETGTADVPGYGHSFTWSSSEVVFTAHGDTSTHEITNKYVEDYGTLTIKKAFDFDDVAGAGTTAEAQKAKELGISIDFLIQQQEGSSWRTVDSLRMVGEGNPGWEETVHLPVGTYRIVERGARLTDQGYTFEGLNVTYSDGTESVALVGDAAGMTGFQVEITGTAGQPGQVTVTAVNEYSRDKGVLKIVKNFSDDADTQAAKALLDEIDVLLYKDGALVDTVTLSANSTPAWEARVEDLEIGQYLLVEVKQKVEAGSTLNTAYLDGYTLIGNWDLGAEVEVVKYDAQNEAQTVAVRKLTNTYAKETGVLEIYKRFENLPADQTPASVMVDVKAGNTLVKTITLTSPNWHVANVVLPVGTYTLVERTADAIDSYTQTGTTFKIFDKDTNGDETLASTAQVTVEEGSAVSARVYLTNTYTQQTGSLTVSKTVVSDLESDKTKGFEFSIDLGQRISKSYEGVVTEKTAAGQTTTNCWVIFTDGKAAFQLKDGQSLTIFDLPVGVGYTVGEKLAEGFTTTILGTQTYGVAGTVKKEATNIPFVNTREVSGEDQGLQISKTVVSPLKADSQKKFKFTVQMDDATVNGKFQSKLNGVSEQVTFTNGAATIEFMDGEVIKIFGLPVGVGFTITEASDADFATTVNGKAITSVKGVIGEGLFTAGYTNTRNVGKQTLTVSKTVQGNGSDESDEFTFEVAIPELKDGVYGDMTFAGGVAKIQLSHGEKAVAVGIPAGVRYTVTETEYGNYMPENVTYTGVLSAQGAEIAFVNTLEKPELPPTGDNSMIALWCALMLMAGMGLMAICRRKA